MVKKKKKTIWDIIQAHPIIANPLIVALYGVLAFLTLEGTDVWDPATYKKASAIGLLALFSALKNTLQVYQEKK